MKSKSRFCFLLYLFLLFISLSSQAQIITTIAGYGGTVWGGDGGPATIAGLDRPYAVAIDKAGDIYIYDGAHYRIRKVDTAGIITSIAGNGTYFYSGDGGPATNAGINVGGLAVDSSGNVYITDSNHIRMINTAGIISVFAGTGIAGYSGDNGPASAAMLDLPGDLTMDAAGNLYFQDSTHIRKINSAGIITTIAGNGLLGDSGDGGPATNAEINPVDGIGVDNIGNVYINQSLYDRVRKISSSGIITTFAGNGMAGYSGDNGPATVAQFSTQIIGLATDNFGNVFIGDHFNYNIRKVNPLGIISTIVGNGTLGFSGDNGPATSAEVNFPERMTAARNGNLYFPDVLNQRVRKVTIPDIAITSSADTICAGVPVSFTATVTNDAGTPQYQWQVNGINVGTNTSVYVTDTLHNGAMVSCILSYIFGDLVTTSSNAITISIDTHPPCASAVASTPVPNEGLTIFPNPNDGTFTLSITTPTNEQATITITNILGEKVKQFTTTTNTLTQLKMEMPEGVYFISATTASGRWNEKVIVNNNR